MAFKLAITKQIVMKYFQLAKGRAVNEITSEEHQDIVTLLANKNSKPAQEISFCVLTPIKVLSLI